jgi:hypothetical protein
VKSVASVYVKVTPIKKKNTFFHFILSTSFERVYFYYVPIHLIELTDLTSNRHAHVDSHKHVYSATVTRGEESRRCGCSIIRSKTLVKYV